MEELKDIRRQLNENPESRELNNRYAQACLDIAKEYTVNVPGTYLYLLALRFRSRTVCHGQDP